MHGALLRNLQPVSGSLLDRTGPKGRYESRHVVVIGEHIPDVARVSADAKFGIDLQRRGIHQLRGVPERCELFSLIDPKGALVPTTVRPTRLRVSDRIIFAAGALGLGVAALWLSVLVLIPLAAV